MSATIYKTIAVEKDGVLRLLPIKTIILFGPPGSGKTTMTGAIASALHWRAIDIEGFFDFKGRYEVEEYLIGRAALGKEQVIGGAGSTEHMLSSIGFKVLFLPSKADYLKLLSIRAKFQPTKLGQGEWKVWEGMNHASLKFDFVFSRPNLPNLVASNVAIIIRKYNEWLYTEGEGKRVEPTSEELMLAKEKGSYDGLPSFRGGLL